MNIRTLLIYDEGLKLRPYLCPAKFWTIAVGRNLESNGLSKSEQTMIFNKSGLDKNEIIEKLKKTGISREQALIMLDNDILYLNEKFKEFDWFLRLSEVRKSVIISMGFNLGFKGFMRFKKLRKALQNDDYELAVIEILDSDAARKLTHRYVRLAKMMETNHWPTDIY